MTTPINSYSAYSSANASYSSTPSPNFGLGGLASGIDTTTIIAKLMQLERLPEQKLQLQLSREGARQQALRDIQTQLQAVQSAEQALRSPALWAPTQTVSVSDPTRVAATMLSGAGPGGYQVGITQLAGSAQRTYSYTTPTVNDTLTVNGVAISIAAGSDINAAAAAINSANGSPVYATVVTNGGVSNLVLSNRQTGAANGITASDTAGAMTEVTSAAVAGQDAQFTVNGVAMTSASNTVTSAIPGVQLTLSALTKVSGPVTVNVSAPGPNQTAIQTAVQTFVTQYNLAVDMITGKLNEKAVSNPQTATDAAKGVLYADTGLSDLLSQLRQSFSASYAPGNPAAYQLLSSIGLSTGAAVGSAALNQDSIHGKISFDTTKFAAAMAADPNSVQTLLGGKLSSPGFAQSFDALLAPVTQGGGILDTRISTEDRTKSQLQAQIAAMEVRLTLKQNTLKRQFAAMESAIQASQAQGQWLAGQLAGLPA
ncbi:MAG: hypothetical protein NVSMB25_16880 [Thermoleophilaceae bacterium]